MDPVPQRKAAAAAATGTAASEGAPVLPGAIPGLSQPASHVLQRAIVLDQQRLFFVPVPKGGCTALLWSLAELARIQESLFTDSEGREVTRSLAIHDLTRWPESFRFGKRSPEHRERLLEADDWLRFTVVRHPVRRLWSAWQSKILLAEPQFITRYSSQPWFPGPVRSAADVLKAFREFLDALEADPELLRADVHWAPQVDVIEYDRVRYDHIGKIEKLDETVDRIREHVRETTEASLPEPPHTNVSTLPYTDELFTEEDVRFLADMYAEDMRVFGYEAPSGDALGRTVPESWLATVEAAAPALEELRLRNQRVADLQVLLKRRRQALRRTIRRKKREEHLRREEHRRNESLQKRLHEATVQLQRMRNSRTWRYTAPIRNASGKLRRVRRNLRGQR